MFLYKIIMNIGIYIYEKVEVLDFSGPFEVFSTASRIHTDNPFSVSLISQHGKAVAARGGFSVNPHFSFGNCPDPDVLVVPGGIHTGEMEKDDVLKWISSVSERTDITASVCTGVFLLAAAGVVFDGEVVTHHEDMEDLKRLFPELQIVKGRRWIDRGKIITSGGISAGIDMSLHIVSKLAGREHALRTAMQMEYDWRE